jgi:hypothetical protein
LAPSIGDGEHDAAARWRTEEDEDQVEVGCAIARAAMVVVVVRVVKMSGCPVVRLYCILELWSMREAEDGAERDA